MELSQSVINIKIQKTVGAYIQPIGACNEILCSSRSCQLWTEHDMILEAHTASKIIRITLQCVILSQSHVVLNTPRIVQAGYDPTYVNIHVSTAPIPVTILDNHIRLVISLAWRWLPLSSTQMYGLEKLYCIVGLYWSSSCVKREIITNPDAWTLGGCLRN
jgi:hypothetical protein